MKTLTSQLSNIDYMSNCIWELKGNTWFQWKRNIQDDVVKQRVDNVPKKVRDCADIYGVSFVYHEDCRFSISDVEPLQDDRHNDGLDDVNEGVDSLRIARLKRELENKTQDVAFKLEQADASLRRLRRQRRQDRHEDELLGLGIVALGARIGSLFGKK